MSLRRLSALGVLLLAACAPSGDRARLSVTLGSAAEALALDGIVIDTFSLTVSCIDGGETVITGDVAADGSFTADVPRCPQATIRFRGLTSGEKPALAGSTDIAIRPPATNVVIPARRVGTVTFVNDDTYASVCSVKAATAPEFDVAFVLQPGQAQEELLPVNGVTLSCAPADECGSVTTCDFTGPLATTRAVAVPFGDATTLSLANLSSALIFSIGPPSPQTAGGTFGPFEVTLVDERNIAIRRSDITVDLVPESSTAHGAFSGGTLPMVDGVAHFGGVSFMTAGVLAFHARAIVDGIILTTESRNVDVFAGATGQLAVVGPSTVTAGAFADFTVTAADSFGNATTLAEAVFLSSNDPQTDPVRFNDPSGVMSYALFTAGTQTITASIASQPTVLGTTQIDVLPGAVSSLAIAGPSALVVGQQAAYTVKAVDAFGNVASNYTGTVQLDLVPVTGGNVPAPHLFSAADAGTFVFSPVSFASPGTWSVGASDGTLTAAGVAVDVTNVGTLDHFDVQINPTTVVAGTNVDINVIGRDAGGNLAAFDAQVPFSSNTGCSGLVAVVAGGGAAQCTTQLAGTFTIDVDYGGITGQSVPLTVTTSTAQQVVIVDPVPSPLIVNEIFDFAFMVTDPYGNPVDPKGFSVSMTLSPPTASIIDHGNEVHGKVVVYHLSVDAQVFTVKINVAANAANGPQDSTSFDVHAPDICSIAQVAPGGTHNGCDGTAPDIATALAQVDDGGEIQVQSGQYAGAFTVSGKRVTIRGGYDPTFSVRSVSTPSVLYSATPTIAIASVQSSAQVVLDGLAIVAPAPLSTNDQRSAVQVNSGSRLIVKGCRLQGAISDLDFNSAVIDIGDADAVLVTNNWIHLGAPSTSGTTAAGYRRGIFSASGSPTVDIVHNTIVVADADRSEALTYGSVGAMTFTNNVVVGDFSTCSNGGVCAIAETSDFGVGSAQHNYVIDLNSSPSAAIYASHNGLYVDLNGPRGASFSGNVTVQASASGFTDAVVDAAGPDTLIYTLPDDNWHLQFDHRTSFDGADAQCGNTANLPCRGTGTDIDGEARCSTPSVGADEFGACAIGDM